MQAMHGILCEICKQRPATTHLTEVGEEAGQSQELHICRTCIKQLGLDLHSKPLPVAAIHELHQQQQDEGPGGKQLGPGIVINLNPESGKTLSKATRGDEDPRCEHCGLTLSRFAKNNRFGCRHCYAAFHEHLDQVFSEIHHDNRHAGRLPEDRADTAQHRFTRRLHLRQRLDQAIAAEDFESAANLRDELQALDESGED